VKPVRWRCRHMPTLHVHLADELVGGGKHRAELLENSPGWAFEVSFHHL